MKRNPVIVAAKRTAVGKANRGSLIHTRPDFMGGVVIQALLEILRSKGHDPLEAVKMVMMGCAMPEAEQGMNVGRQCIHVASMLAKDTNIDQIPGMTLNNYCASGMSTQWLLSLQIAAGQFWGGIAGGTESMSMVPMGGNKIVANPDMVRFYPQAYIGMLETAENVARKYGITRKMQDQMALLSNSRALAANESGAFKEQIIPMTTFLYDGNGGKREFVFEKDEGPRKSTMEGLEGLKSAFTAPPRAQPSGGLPEKLWDGSEFHPDVPAGTVTAGNSSQMSDGAAGLLIMDLAKAVELGLKPLAKLHGVSQVAFDAAEMGIGPALAIPELMRTFGESLGLETFDDIDVFEINEAFASQAYFSLEKLGLLDRWKAGDVNPNGGAIALGHPLGATGAKLATQIIHHMRDKNLKWGIVSMCIGGGMGAAGLYENLQFEA